MPALPRCAATAVRLVGPGCLQRSLKARADICRQKNKLPALWQSVLPSLHEQAARGCISEAQGGQAYVSTVETPSVGAVFDRAFSSGFCVLANPVRVCHGCRNTCLALKQSAPKTESKESKHAIAVIVPPIWASVGSTKDCAKCRKVTEKRKHCRTCGRLFCSDCASSRMPLPPAFLKTQRSESPSSQAIVCDFCRYLIFDGAQFFDPKTVEPAGHQRRPSTLLTSSLGTLLTSFPTLCSLSAVMCAQIW